jgi:hypothetical protein
MPFMVINSIKEIHDKKNRISANASILVTLRKNKHILKIYSIYNNLIILFCKWYVVTKLKKTKF